jgi:Leucine-rich repeat (LRR) protein
MTQNRWNNLKSIKNIKHLINLEDLHIINSGLEELEVDIFKQNPKLVKLDVSRNNLNKFYPNTLRHLIHLDDINIGQNPIEKIPSQFFGNARNLRIIRFTV